MFTFETVKGLRKKFSDDVYIEILETFLIALGDTGNVNDYGLAVCALKSQIAVTAIVKVKAIMQDDKSKNAQTKK